MNSPKPFRTYADQVQILSDRGIVVEDATRAQEQLATLNYYRLSGYWHTMRQTDPGHGNSSDSFREGASFDLTVALYEFDERLRQACFADLSRIELAMRALVGYHLGKLDPLIHLHADQLGAPARHASRRPECRTIHDEWVKRYNSELSRSREDFVRHHVHRYSGNLPIWVAVETMDWGMLSRLFRMSPNRARRAIAQECGLSAPQLESWLRSLNILRNYSAHHTRIFNRSFDITPRLNQGSCFDAVRNRSNRVFAQLTLIRYLHRELGLEPRNHLPEVLRTYPHNHLVPFSRTGAPEDWEEHELWRPAQEESY